MKKILSFLSCFIIASATALNVAQAVTIQSGTILYSAGTYLAGQPIKVGFDPYGYNYQARSFSGSYFNAYANSAGLPPYTGDDATYLAANPSAAGHWAWPYRNDKLKMDWNDAWLSNEDNDGDGKLDRHYGFASYVGSGAWLTNHVTGEYELNGKTVKWVDFVKILAVPSDATLSGGDWYRSDGTLIGYNIWGEFALVQEIYNDPGSGAHGILYRGLAGPGVGVY